MKVTHRFKDKNGVEVGIVPNGGEMEVLKTTIYLLSDGIEEELVFTHTVVTSSYEAHVRNYFLFGDRRS